MGHEREVDLITSALETTGDLWKINLRVTRMKIRGYCRCSARKVDLWPRVLVLKMRREGIIEDCCNESIVRI